MTATIVFDLDGTLVDSLADLAQAVNRMLGEVDLPPLPPQTIQGFVGNGLPKLVERAMDHCALPMERHAELTRMTLRHYSAATCDKTTVYPGIRDSLSELRDWGCALGVCTNKPEEPARHVLDALGLSEFFQIVLGGDSMETRKPDPAHLYASFDAMTDTGPRLFVGDSEVDAETARRADIPFLLFTNGYRKTPIAEMSHQASYDHGRDLPGCVLSTLRGNAGAGGSRD